MSKMAIPGRVRRKRGDGTKMPGKKTVSHGTFRCQRKPNSPKCKNKS
jgi:hypothetical protein